MIEESRVLGYSGREYAIVKWGSWLKLFMLSAIFMNVFVIPWGLGDGTSIAGGCWGRSRCWANWWRAGRRSW